MAERLVPSRTAVIFVRLWNWIKNQIVQDIPAGLAVCEFECRRPQCTVSHWRTCELIRNKPAIEPIEVFQLVQ
jgi:hypothetical protein